MAKKVGLTQAAVLRIWQAWGLQLHRQQTCTRFKDPQFIDKVRERRRARPQPARAGRRALRRPKAQIQALDKTAPILPGTPGRATHDDKRSGTSSLYAALDLTTGKVIGRLHSRHRAIEFKQLLATLDRQVPADLDVHVKLDNSSTHRRQPSSAGRRPIPALSCTSLPTSSSWLSLVERWVAERTNKLLRRGAHCSVAAPNADIRAGIDT